MGVNAPREEQFARRALVGSVMLLGVGMCSQIAAAHMSAGSAALMVCVALAFTTMYAMYRRRSDRARVAEELSLTDPLTGLRNRRYVDQVIEMDVAASIRHHRDAADVAQSAVDADLVFLFLDLDHFKKINDTYGHAVGDRVLRSVAHVLRDVSRDCDIVARWGGEEFLIIGRFTDRVLAGVTAERLREVVENHVVVLDDGLHLSVTCSIGFAAFPFNPVDRYALSWDRVLQLADLAAYDAKRSGRNRWVGYASAGWVPVLGQRIALEEADRWVASGRLLRLTKDGYVEPAQPAAHADRSRLHLIPRVSAGSGSRPPRYPGSPVRAG